MSQRIGILTGGGDVPGLNACIKAAVYRANEHGYEMVGIKRGWAGLLYTNPDDEGSHESNVMVLTADSVRAIDRSGGTFLHTSRTNPSNVKISRIPEFLTSVPEAEVGRKSVDLTQHILRVLDKLEISALILIGGDDTLSYGHRMHTEGIKVVAIPKTMDNDVFGTDYCIGFSTAVTRSVDYITQLRTSIGSHERIGIIELFGRNSGETALISALLAGADRAIISEVPFDPERLARLLSDDVHRSPSNYAVMTISEGARIIGGEIQEIGPADAYGHRKLGGIGSLTAQEIRHRTHRNVIYQQLGYLMRSGVPDSLDRMVSVNFGILAVDLIHKGETGRLVAVREGRYTHQDLDIVAKGVRRVDVDTFYDLQQYRPKVSDVLGKPMFLY